MLDINEAIDDRNQQQHDPEGDMSAQEPWSYKIAQNLARKEGLGDLSDGQWRVIHTLRCFYRKNGRAKSSRQIMQALVKALDPEGGGRLFYRLFPDGAIVQGSRLAGVPGPAAGS
jgi:tRNA 2-thiouridine synthesizing protein E